MVTLNLKIFEFVKIKLFEIELSYSSFFFQSKCNLPKGVICCFTYKVDPPFL